MAQQLLCRNCRKEIIPDIISSTYFRHRESKGVFCYPDRAMPIKDIEYDILTIKDYLDTRWAITVYEIRENDTHPDEILLICSGLDKEDFDWIKDCGYELDFLTTNDTYHATNLTFRKIK